MKKRNAFTLVELLVVIGIISVLVAMLLPALNKARVQAVSVQCLSNHRQIVMAIMQYAADYGDTLPPDPNQAYYPTVAWGNTTMTGTASNPVWVSWIDAPLVGHYMSLSNMTNLLGQWPYGPATNTAIYCPVLLTANLVSGSYGVDTGIGINFMWNCQLWPDKLGPTRLSQIRSPSKLVMLSDAATAGYTYGSCSWGTITREINGLPYDVNGALQVNTYGTNAYRHGGKCTLGFADGHAELSADVVTANTQGQITTIARNH